VAFFIEKKFMLPHFKEEKLSAGKVKHLLNVI
jgi:hypothetical protein